MVDKALRCPALKTVVAFDIRDELDIWMIDVK
jgi:hypothetical protein